MPRTVILTGYSGFLGRYTLEALEAAGWQVYLAGRVPPSDGGHAGYFHVQLDRLETIAALAEHGPFDAVVHLACHVGWAGATEAEMLAPNVLATGLLADLSRTWNAHMFFASAALVHGVAERVIGIDSPVIADTPYTRSKWLGEMLIGASGADHCILRMGGLFGRRGPNHLGLNRAIDASLGGESPVLVGEGAALRNYLFVKDAAATIAAALDQRTLGVHLLAGPEVLSVRAMLEAVCDTFNPGSAPLRQAGGAARDQIIERSGALIPGVPFVAALQDIAAEARACASA